MITNTFFWTIVNYCSWGDFDKRRAEVYPLLNKEERLAFKSVFLARSYGASPETFKKFLKQMD